MNSDIFPDHYDLALAKFSLIKLKKVETIEFFVIDCNDRFTELTGLKSNPEKNQGPFAFGQNSNEYLSRLYYWEDVDKKDDLVFRFQQTSKWVLLKIKQEKDKTLNCYAIDFTMIQRQLNAFSLQKVGYRQYIRNFHGLAFQRLLKPERKPVFTAGAYEEITGYSSEQAKDFTSWSEIIHPDDKEKITEMASMLYNQTGFKEETEYRIIRKDGEIRWMHSYDSNFLSEDGNMQMVQGLIVDVTNQKELELKLQSANKKLSNRIWSLKRCP